VKNYLTSLSNEKLSALSILNNIENKMLKQIEWKQIIHKFAPGKVTGKKFI